MTDAGSLRIGIDGRWMSDRYPGIGRSVFNLLRALPSPSPGEGFLVPIDALSRQARFNLGELQTCDLNPVPGGGPLTPRGQLAVCRLVRAASLDLFHATYFPGALGVRAPKIVTIHDVIPIQFPESIPALPQRLLYRLMLKRVLTSARRIFTPTQATRRLLTDLLGVDPDRIVVTPHGAEARFAPVSGGELAAPRRRLGLPDRYLLYLGVNKPHKNLRRLVEAWATAVDRGEKGYWLVFAGPADRRFPSPDRLAEELHADKIVVLGRVAEGDLPALIGAADALIQPSLCEGFGLPILEAMACGVPVACSSIPTFKEIAGTAALGFDPLDTGSVAAAIERLIGQPELRRELSRRGRERARLFSWRRTAELTVANYREVVLGL